MKRSSRLPCRVSLLEATLKEAATHAVCLRFLGRDSYEVVSTELEGPQVSADSMAFARGLVVAKLWAASNCNL